MRQRLNRFFSKPRNVVIVSSALTALLLVAAAAFWLISSQSGRHMLIALYYERAVNFSNEVIEADRVEIGGIIGYDPDGTMTVESTFCGEAAHSVVTITEPSTVAQFTKPWRFMIFDPGFSAMCHEPPYGFRYYKGDQLIAEASVCWSCSNIQIDGFLGHGLYGFKAKSITGMLYDAQQIIPLKIPSKYQPILDQAAQHQQDLLSPDYMTALAAYSKLMDVRLYGYPILMDSWLNENMSGERWTQLTLDYCMNHKSPEAGMHIIGNFNIYVFRMAMSDIATCQLLGQRYAADRDLYTDETLVQWLNGTSGRNWAAYVALKHRHPKLPEIPAERDRYIDYELRDTVEELLGIE